MDGIIANIVIYKLRFIKIDNLRIFKSKICILSINFIKSTIFTAGNLD